MCAIHGILSKRTSIQEMIKAAHHRGPDANAFWSDNHITLGHNLLSIVDEPINSTQPFKHNDWVLVYNGEIYNYKELGKEFDLRTDTDTEVLIRGIEKYGASFTEKCDGMFAFACYNKNTHELILARDSNGTKPLYYGEKDGVLHFSSEIKSLLTQGFERKICKQALKHYYKQGLVSGYLTLFEGIKKLVPGEVVIMNVITKEKKTFNLNNTQPTNLILGRSTHELREQFVENLNKAVEMSLMGRRNIGLFLSGGLDSTSILYEMVNLGVQPNTFTSFFELTLPDSRLNEDSEIAQKYCAELNVLNKQLHQNEQAYVDAMDDTFYALEEPRQGKSFATYYNTNKFLSQNNITVTLSGDGGDELLAGYKHHGAGDWRTKLNALGMNNDSLKNPELNCTLDEQMNYLKEWLPTGQLQKDPINDMMYIECLNTLCDDFLIRNDKLGMRFSMEARFPMMLKVFRDWARSIPSKQKCNDDKKRFRVKHLFKETYRGRLPGYITDRHKTGWRFPTDEILIGDAGNPGREDSTLRQFIIETLKDKELQDIFEYNDDKVLNVYLNNKNFRPNEGSKHAPGKIKQKELFTILNFAVWKKVFNMSI